MSERTTIVNQSLLEAPCPLSGALYNRFADKYNKSFHAENPLSARLLLVPFLARRLVDLQAFLGTKWFSASPPNCGPTSFKFDTEPNCTKVEVTFLVTLNHTRGSVRGAVWRRVDTAAQLFAVELGYMLYMAGRGESPADETR